MIALPENVGPLLICRPSLMITGFLGAGKTTFMRSLLVDLHRRQIAADVILNDYENAEIDAGTLRGDAASVEALAASCACCDGLAPLVDLAVAAGRSVNDLLVIELNGTADPLPLLESFTLLESRLRFRPRWQVCVLDARQFPRSGNHGALESLQLQTASHFMLSHVEGLTELQRGSLLERVRAVNPRASETDAGTMAESLAQAIARDQRLLSRVPPPATKPLLPGPGRCGSRLAHEFTGCQIFLPPTVKRAAMWAWLASLPPDVIRAKALATVTGEPGVRRLFERVGMELMGDPLEVPISEKVPSTGICIGPDLNPVEILELAMRQFGGRCGLTPVA
jgi:G3E family GTPase